ncbi:hypothetical protein I546_0898 [Mycobacterium kansasii 732]|nr:hypothetical protein I546_0898 [Mycobacterium kansasii 732]
MNDHDGSPLTASIVAVVVPLSRGRPGDPPGRDDARRYR